MVSQILSQEPLTLAQASQILPTRPHINTLRRWCHSGVNGVKLGNFRCGSKKICTTRVMLNEFLAAVNPSSDGTQVVESAGHKAAEEKLAAMGV